MSAMEIRHLYISDGHNYFGHHGNPPGSHPVTEVGTVECVAGHGIRGDRFFDYRDDYKGQITFFALEVFHELCRAFPVPNASPGLLRRNVIVAGIDLNSLIGETFDVQGVSFHGTGECKPCYWMDQAFAPGTEKYLLGRGGLRARILSDGQLRSASSIPERAIA